MEIVKINAEEYGLEEKQAKEITKGLDTILTERNVLVESYEKIISLEIVKENIPKFKDLRMLIVKNRTQGLKLWHKTNKAYFLAGGNFVQAIYNKEVAENERMENQLMSAEKHFENLEKERIKKIDSERTIILSKYQPDIITPGLGEMPEEVWNNFLAGTRLNYEYKIEAEKKAEEQRIEQEKKDLEAKIKYEKEQEAIRKENERLKKEAEKKEIERQKEIKARQRLEKIKFDILEKRNTELRPYLIFIRDYNKMINLSDSEYKKELSDIKKGAEEHWKFEKEQKAAAEKKEDELNARMQEQLDKEEAERVRIINEEIAEKNKEKAAKLAPDKEKLIILANQIEAFELPTLTSDEANKILRSVKVLLAKTKVYINENINKI